MSTVLIAISIVTMLAPSDAVATTGQPRFPAVVNGHAPALHPEGVAFDPLRRTFLVSSLRHGTVSVVTPDGRTSTLVSDPRMVSTAGVHVDAARGRILVTYVDIGVSERSEPDPARRRTGLGIFDLRTGAARHIVDLAIGPHLANDLTIDRDGNAYVTDSAADAIYRVDPAGHPSVFRRDQRFAPVTSAVPGINGIVWHPAGYLVVGKYDTGALFRVPLRGHQQITEIHLRRPLPGADGLARRRNGDLVVVTNDLGAPRSHDALMVLRSGDNWRTAHERSSEAWPVDDPTTVAVSPFGDYAVSGNLAILLQGATSNSFTLRRR